MPKMPKTHAMRVLDAKGVPYRATAYDTSGAFHAADEAAALVGASLDAVYKTLVVLRESAGARPLMVMAPSTGELDLRALAKALGEKKLRMATQREAERLTGMQVGGISTLGVRKPSFEVLIDDRARALDEIHISAGIRGVELALRVDDLVALTGARYVRLIP